MNEKREREREKIFNIFNIPTFLPSRNGKLGSKINTRRTVDEYVLNVHLKQIFSLSLSLTYVLTYIFYFEKEAKIIFKKIRTLL